MSGRLMPPMPSSPSSSLKNRPSLGRRPRQPQPRKVISHLIRMATEKVQHERVAAHLAVMVHEQEFFGPAPLPYIWNASAGIFAAVSSDFLTARIFVCTVECSECDMSSTVTKTRVLLVFVPCSAESKNGVVKPDPISSTSACGNTKILTSGAGQGVTTACLVVPPVASVPMKR